MSALRTRKPTGLAPWPFLVIEGAEKSGKSFSTALLSGDPRIGTTYWFDLGEGAADQYGLLPGARYEVVDFDGSYRQLRAAVDELVATIPGIDATGRPNVAVIDSATNLWTMLKNEANQAALDRAREKAKRFNKPTPDEAQVTMDLWNRAANRWKAIVDPLIQWPGIVIFTARGKEVAALDDAGKPIANAPKVYTIEAHKTMVFDADVIVRAVRPGIVKVTGARSAHDLRRVLDVEGDQTLAGILFDVLKLGGQMGTRDLKVAAVETDSTELAELVTAALEAIAKAPTDVALRKIWDGVKDTLPADTEERQTVLAAVTARLQTLRAAAPAVAPAASLDQDPLATYEPAAA